MRRKTGSLLLCALLLTVLLVAQAEVAEGVRSLAWPYYEAAVGVAMDSLDYGRNFTDHKKAHAEMVAEKSLEAGRAFQEAVALGTLGGGAEADRIAFSGEIDLMVLECAALFHDTGMCGGGYALNAEPSQKRAYERNAEGLYATHPEDPLDFPEIRTFHSLNSGLYVLVNRTGLLELGLTDAQVDVMAAMCVAHSKSNSGVRDLNSRADWTECFDRLDSVVFAWNQDHPEAPIAFRRETLEANDGLLSALATETLALRVGDVSRDSGPDAEVQTGEKVHVDRDTLNDQGGSIPAELEGAAITLGEASEPMEPEKSRQVHAGEQNISENHTFVNEAGRVTHEITVVDSCSAPRCTQQAVDDHLGEFYSARDGQFEVRIRFDSFEDGEDGFFRDSWEDFRLQAAQDYGNIEILFPWDEAVRNGAESSAD